MSNRVCVIVTAAEYIAVSNGDKRLDEANLIYRGSNGGHVIGQLPQGYSSVSLFTHQEANDIVEAECYGLFILDTTQV